MTYGSLRGIQRVANRITRHALRARAAASDAYWRLAGAYVRAWPVTP